MPKMGQIQPVTFWPDDNLLTRSLPVPEELYGSNALYELVQNMTATMLMTGGVGISAIQIGVPWRVCIIGVDEKGNRLKEGDTRTLVNPEIMVVDPAEYEHMTRPPKMVRMEEGCLSFPRVLQHIIRPDYITVTHTDEDGDVSYDLDCDGWLARCIQHEVDHLDGVLFIDRMGRMERRMAKKQMAKFKKSVTTKWRAKPKQNRSKR
jgi:peptide deformylase